MKLKGSEVSLLTLAVAAVAAEVAAARVLKLPVTLRADADHVGHDGSGDGFLLGVDLGGVLAHCARRVGEILDAAHRDHDALGDSLLG